MENDSLKRVLTKDQIIYLSYNEIISSNLSNYSFVGQLKTKQLSPDNILFEEIIEEIIENITKSFQKYNLNIILNEDN